MSATSARLARWYIDHPPVIAIIGAAQTATEATPTITASAQSRTGRPQNSQTRSGLDSSGMVGRSEPASPNAATTRSSQPVVGARRTRTATASRSSVTSASAACDWPSAP